MRYSLIASEIVILTQVVTIESFVIVKKLRLSQAVDAGSEYEQDHFQFKAFGGDSMNGLR